MIAAGADVNTPNKRGKTALELAAKYGNADAVNLLLAAGAEVSEQAVRSATPEVQILLRAAQ